MSPSTNKCIVINGKNVLLRHRFAVVMRSRGFAIVRGFIDGFVITDQLLIFAPPARLETAAAEARALASQYHLFRGRVLFADRNGLGVKDVPHDSDWSRIVPAPEIRMAGRELLAMAADPNAARGIMIVGPPGTGKTAHIRSIMRDFAGLGTVIVVQGISDDMSIRKLYALARDTAPTLVILEDLDTLAGTRESSGGGQSSFNLADLLGVLDGEVAYRGVFTVATTNYPEFIDRALVARPGRFERIYELGYPDRATRRKIFELYRARHEMPPPPPLARRFVDDLEKVTPDHLRALAEGVVTRRSWSEKSWDDCYRAVAAELTQTLASDSRFGDAGQMGFGGPAEPPPGEIDAEFDA